MGITRLVIRILRVGNDHYLSENLIQVISSILFVSTPLDEVVEACLFNNLTRVLPGSLFE
jgi:hypothetical protein